MENKYYLPKIEELHVGFEYWLKSKEPTSTKRVPIIIKNFSDVQDAIRCFAFDDIVVKHLSKEDIESFGFKVEKDDEYAGEYYFSKENSIIGKFLTEDKKYNIELFSTYFIVKNKSEFKKLLMQLDLINE